PHHLHYEVASRALEAGKHVLIEKPMAPSEKECASLIALAKSKGLAISVAENTPFVQAYVEVERIVRSGTVGRPRLIRTFIYGSEGSLIVDQLYDPPVVHFHGAKDMRGHPVRSVAFDPTYWKSKSIAAGAAAFAGAVSRGEPPPVDPLDGLYSIRVSEKAYQS